jgi:hypothetical protein
MNDTGNNRIASSVRSYQSDRSVRDNLNRSDSGEHPTSGQKRCAFGYVAKTEDIIIRHKASTGWLLLIPGALIALGTSIAAYRESNAPHNMSTVLLMLPILQLLTTSAVWLWVRDRALPHVWVRGYSPNHDLQESNPPVES